MAADPDPAHAAEPRSPNAVFGDVTRIVTPDGVQEDRLISVGGIQQRISIRGRHRDNPILLILHGGPGFTTAPVGYYYMRDWEEYFTVVHWDQRAAGKTYAANDPAAATTGLTVARMVDDAEGVAAYLRTTYHRDKIVLLGHSFGTILGVKLAQRRPDWFYAYVGMGQFVGFARNEALGYQQTLAAARAAGDAKAVAELEALAPFPDPDHPERNLKNLSVERRWLAAYDGYYWRNGFGHNGDISSFSPDDSADDLKARDAAMQLSTQALWSELGKVDLAPVTRFDCPLVFLQGRHDRGTSSTLLAAWYETLSAPSKQLIWFDDSAHMVFEEEPGKTLVSLVQTVLPLTRTPPSSPRP